MFKITCASFMVFLGVVQADAGNCCPLPSLKNGWNIGVECGVEASKIRADVSGRTKQREHGVNQGVTGRLLLGYSYDVLPCLNLAGEAFGQVNSTEVRYGQAIADATSKLDTRYSFGLKFMPGMNFARNVRGFLAVGPVWKTYQYHPSVFAVDAGSPSKFDTTKIGLLVGIGMEAALSRCLSLRLEYNYTSMAHWTISGAGVTSTFRPESNECLLGLFYHF